MTETQKSIEYFNRVNKSPCFQCETRYLNCHTQCPKYKIYKVLQEKKTEKIKQQQKEHTDTYYKPAITAYKRKERNKYGTK